jgi:uncharacterized protein (DUF2267 family)
MDELIKQVTERAHISDDQARTAIQTVASFLKEKLPPQMAGQVDAVMSGSAPNLGDAAKGLGGMFGR